MALVDEKFVQSDFFRTRFFAALFCGVGHSLVLRSVA
jgi:hypothetical protein